jgi:hypothetical protein
MSQRVDMFRGYLVDSQDALNFELSPSHGHLVLRV